jgi:hypothetical protein
MRKFYNLFFNKSDKFEKTEETPNVNRDIEDDISDENSIKSSQVFFYSKSLSLLSLLPLSSIISPYKDGDYLIPDFLIGISNMRFVPKTELKDIDLTTPHLKVSPLVNFDFKQIQGLVPTFITLSKDSFIDVHISCFADSFKHSKQNNFKVVCPTFVLVNQVFYPTLSFLVDNMFVTVVCFSDKIYLFSSHPEPVSYLIISPFF